VASSFKCDDDANCNDGSLRRRCQQVRLPGTNTFAHSDSDSDSDAFTIAIAFVLTVTIGFTVAVAVILAFTIDRHEIASHPNPDTGLQN
jgi:hypothetical protein